MQNLSQCESKHLPGTACQGVESLPVEWEEKPICGPDEGKWNSWGLDLGRKLFGREADLILWGNQKPAGRVKASAVSTESWRDSLQLAQARRWWGCFPSKPIQAGALQEPGFTAAMDHFGSGLESPDICMSGYFILIGIGVAPSCTTSNQRANREHHSDPAISPCFVY